MARTSFHLLAVLVIAVAAAPMRGHWMTPRAHDPDAAPSASHGHEHAHAHVHEHRHGDLTHAHAHHHHSGEPADEEQEHHHGVVDPAPDGVMIRWTAPRRTQVDAPPVPPRALVAATCVTSDWQPRRRAKPPPPPVASAQLSPSIRTIVLRL